MLHTLQGMSYDQACDQKRIWIYHDSNVLIYSLQVYTTELLASSTLFKWPNLTCSLHNKIHTLLSTQGI